MFCTSFFFCSVFGDPHRQWKFRIEDRGEPPPTSVSICVSNFSARACSQLGTTAYNFYVHSLRCLHFAFAYLQNVLFVLVGLVNNIKSDLSSQLIKYEGFRLCCEIAFVKIFIYPSSVSGYQRTGEGEGGKNTRESSPGGYNTWEGERE